MKCKLLLTSIVRSWVDASEDDRRSPNPKSAPHDFYPSCVSDPGKEACFAAHLVVVFVKHIALIAVLCHGNPPQRRRSQTSAIGLDCAGCGCEGLPVT